MSDPLHLNGKISPTLIPVVIWLLGATVGGIWWAAGLSKSVEALKATDETRAHVVEEVYQIRSDVKANQGNATALERRLDRVEQLIDDIRFQTRTVADGLLKLDGDYRRRFPTFPPAGTPQ